MWHSWKQQNETTNWDWPKIKLSFNRDGPGICWEQATIKIICPKEQFQLGFEMTNNDA